MPDLLNDLRTKWERVPEYKDVRAEYWKPGDAQVEECPNGCELEIYEDTLAKWARISGYDVYRQTRICRKHGFARIYVISGVTALASNWNPRSE